MKANKQLQRIPVIFSSKINLPRDARNSILSIFGPIFGTVETSNIKPPDAILMRMQLLRVSVISPNILATLV